MEIIQVVKMIKISKEHIIYKTKFDFEIIFPLLVLSILPFILYSEYPIIALAIICLTFSVLVWILIFQKKVILYPDKLLITFQIRLGRNYILIPKDNIKRIEFDYHKYGYSPNTRPTLRWRIKSLNGGTYNIVDRISLNDLHVLRKIYLELKQYGIEFKVNSIISDHKKIFT